jgi:hypothetical protein
LQVGIGVEALPNADRNIDSFLNQIDSAIGCDALNAQLRMGCEETRQGTCNCALKSEWTAQPNEPARLALHAKRNLLGCLGFDDRRTRMLEDLLANLGQTETSCCSIEQPHAKPLLQQGDATADARFWQAQCAGGSREPVMDNDSGEKLEVIEVAHLILVLD